MTTPTLQELPKTNILGYFDHPALLKHREDYARPAVEALRKLLELEADGYHAAERSIEVWECARAVLALYDKKA